MEEKLEKKGKLYLFVTFIVCIAVAVGSFFLGYQWSNKRVENSISCTYAVDNQATLVNTTTGDYNHNLGIGCPVSWDTSSNDIFGMYMNDFYVRYEIVQGVYAFVFKSNFWVYYYAYGSKSYFDFYNMNYGSADGNSFHIVNYRELNDNYDIFLNTTFSSGQRSNMGNSFLSKTCALWYSKTTGGIGDIVGYDFGIQKLADAPEKPWYVPSGWGVTNNSNLCVFVVSLFDFDGNRVTFSMLTDLTGLDTYWNRVYYFSGFGDSYDQGYYDGYENGKNQGSQDGYEDGYSAGQNVGYSAGYSAGVLDANDYSFLGLISAVVDAPIKIFSGLFDFNVFGVNMRNFLFSLASITLVIVIVRFVLARKE